jgi:hypothetical protein
MRETSDGCAATRSGVPSVWLVLAVVTNSCLFLVSCPFNDAQERCSEMAKKLYEARETGQPEVFSP